ncbi:MAG: methyltransferase domain-containing protein [Candidatus Campbellbacteria bacterium]|nr:methyltransferase domain-containing protein [Candidatus Campbellbacteria bacterium]
MKEDHSIPEIMNSREDLIEQLKQKDVLRSEELEKAFKKIDRADFVLGDYVPEAYEDYPLPILGDQTISQPTTVAFMLELLDPILGEKILDVGSGSGWTTALLAEMVGKEGEVTGIEIVDELVEMGQGNLKRYDYPQAGVYKSGEVEIPENYYDKVLVSATISSNIPEHFIRSLKEDGLLVSPVGEAITQYKKQDGGLIELKTFPGFVFVPYIYNVEE